MKVDLIGIFLTSIIKKHILQEKMNSVHESRFMTVLESLSVISRLTENKKLKIGNGVVDIDNRGLQTFLRYYSKDKRDKCHVQVRLLFEESIEIAKSFLKEIVDERQTKSNDEYGLKRDKALRQFGRINQALELALDGYLTQLTTYKDDDKHCSKVQVLVDEIREELVDMGLHLQSHEKARSQNKETKTVPLPAKSEPVASHHNKEEPSFMNVPKQKSVDEEDDVYDPFN